MVGYSHILIATRLGCGNFRLGQVWVASGCGTFRIRISKKNSPLRLDAAGYAQSRRWSLQMRHTIGFCCIDIPLRRCFNGHNIECLGHH